MQHLNTLCIGRCEMCYLELTLHFLLYNHSGRCYRHSEQLYKHWLLVPIPRYKQLWVVQSEQIMMNPTVTENHCNNTNDRWQQIERLIVSTLIVRHKCRLDKRDWSVHEDLVHMTGRIDSGITLCSRCHLAFSCFKRASNESTVGCEDARRPWRAFVLGVATSTPPPFFLTTAGEVVADIFFSAFTRRCLLTSTGRDGTGWGEHIMDDRKKMTDGWGTGKWERDLHKKALQFRMNLSSSRPLKKLCQIVALTCMK